jgi:galactonate dehydratase
MIVTEVETLRLGRFPNVLWVLVHTDEGLTGLGEAKKIATMAEAYHLPVAPLCKQAQPERSVRSSSPRG